jgi:tetratricopeptide (TPR) repeat protein
MLRNQLRVILVVSSAHFAFPQTPSAPTAQEVFASTLGDLRGRSEMIDQSRREDWSNPGSLYSLLGGPVAKSPMPFDTIRSAAPVHSSAGTVSAKRLRHHPPKAARQAYEKASRLARKKEDQKAATELERAIALDPDFAEAHCYLGALYARLRRIPEAAAELRRAIELIPDESIPHSDLAWVLFAMDQRAEAEQHARRAIQLSSDNASAHLLIGRLLIETPKTRAEGLQHLEYAGRTIPDAERLLKALNTK